ncbi:Imm10 family immunity protein [Actinomadura sp. 7K507]|uniref:Imm10 family immunity protein n=1 Tax=Actinomadura sp. 7K507 TaxID=2530365 RepID=UPI00104B5976|nr:Imm10 family immunity protein [Actinomadura sp. 7K507]TDC92027.1 hypothetical protein E1285_12175 [Actinomadura sp. 7K507]
MAQVMTAQEAGVEESFSLLMVGIAEMRGVVGGTAIMFQCDLERSQPNDEDAWPQDKTYCVTNERGAVHYGGVQEVVLDGALLRIVFSESATTALALDDSIMEMSLEVSDTDREAIRDGLRRVLSCGRREYQPTILQL